MTAVRASRERVGPRLAQAVAGAVAAVLVVTAFVVRMTFELPETAPVPQRLVPALVALAALCAFGLLAGRAPLAAWLAAATAAGIAAVEILAVCRGLLDQASPGEAAALVAASAVSGFAAMGTALAYLVVPRKPREHRVVGLAAVTVAAGAVAIGLIAVAAALLAGGRGTVLAASPADLSPVRLMNRILLGSAALAIALGLVRDVGIMTARARARVRSGAVSDAASPLLVALADELLPLRARARERATEVERARLAADLHAIVIPELRQAAAAADHGATAADVADGVRRGLEGVERLMHERQSIVLEEFGLVAALEWLAERTEERADLVVELDLDGEHVTARDALPAEVGRAAFRVALLALDNIVRHADARRATVALSVADRALSLGVLDDGRRAWIPEARHAGRGLADMRREAARVGGELAVEHARGGTAVRLSWPARTVAQHHAGPDARIAAGPDAIGS